jgi:predicted lipoprotein with Yx(FWY)xxD motif
MANISPEEEQRGWRKLYLWILPLALVFGTALLFIPSLMNWMSGEEQRGMDEVVPQDAPVTGKQALGPAKLEIESNHRYGEYLTDASGHPIYIFKGDSRGEQGRQAESRCFDDCAKSWPPVLTSGPPEVSAPLSQNLVGTLKRQDNASSQVTYNGWPLYIYVKDVGPEGEVAGQAIEDFGSRWYLVNPSGAEVSANASGIEP